MNILNMYLGIRYKLFNKRLKRKHFSGTVGWKLDLKNPNYKISDGKIYAGHSRTSRQCVKVEPDGLHLKVKRTAGNFVNWSGSCDCKWKIGWIDLHGEKFPPYGTWVWNVKLAPGSWNALWLLRNGYWVDKYGKNFITPEVDIMELLTDKFKLQHNVHYGFSKDKYKTHSAGSAMFKPGKSLHYEFAVEILPKKYKFYINGILTAVIKKGRSDKTLYPLMNNAVQIFDGDRATAPADFVIKDCTFLSNQRNFLLK